MSAVNALSIHYEGYWQCRQATDPDPSRDRRGASGYTFAIGKESVRVQVNAHRVILDLTWSNSSLIQLRSHMRNQRANRLIFYHLAGTIDDHTG